MDARTRFSTRIVGGLPVVAAYLEDVGIGQIVDEVVPWEGEVPLGTLVEILIMNRLLKPEALYNIGSWSEQASVTDYYKVTAKQLNDDRLGRAFERIAQHGEAVQVPLALKVMKKFRAVGRLPWCLLRDVQEAGSRYPSGRLDQNANHRLCLPRLPRKTQGSAVSRSQL